MADWNEVEKTISEEIEFLKNNISPSPFEQNDPIKCDYCLLRKIAIFIVSGKIKLRKFFYQISAKGISMITTESLSTISIA